MGRAPKRPDQRFLRKPKPFWASVRTVSQTVGYTQRGTGRIKVPGLADMQMAFHDLGLSAGVLRASDGSPTALATDLQHTSSIAPTS